MSQLLCIFKKSFIHWNFTFLPSGRPVPLTQSFSPLVQNVMTIWRIPVVLPTDIINCLVIRSKKIPFYKLKVPLHWELQSESTRGSMNAILLWHKVPTSWRSRGVRGMSPRREEPTTHGCSAKELDYISLSVHWFLMKRNLPLKQENLQENHPWRNLPPKQRNEGKLLGIMLRSVLNPPQRCLPQHKVNLVLMMNSLSTPLKTQNWRMVCSMKFA